MRISRRFFASTYSTSSAVDKPSVLPSASPMVRHLFSLLNKHPGFNHWLILTDSLEPQTISHFNAISSNPRYPMPFLITSTIEHFIKRGDLFNASLFLREAQKSQIRLPDSIYNFFLKRAEIAQDWPSCIQLYDALCVNSKPSHLSRYVALKAYCILGMEDDAIVCYESLDSQSPEMVYIMIQFYCARHNTGQVVKYLQQLFREPCKSFPVNGREWQWKKFGLVFKILDDYLIAQTQQPQTPESLALFLSLAKLLSRNGFQIPPSCYKLLIKTAVSSTDGEDMQFGYYLFSRIRSQSRKFRPDLSIYHSLIAKFPQKAGWIYRDLRTHTTNIPTFLHNALLKSLLHSPPEIPSKSLLLKVIAHFDTISTPDSASLTYLIHAHAVHGEIADAMFHFSTTLPHLAREVIAYNILMNAYVDSSPEKVIGLFERMKGEGIDPTSVTYHKILRSIHNSHPEIAENILDEMISKAIETSPTIAIHDCIAATSHLMHSSIKRGDMTSASRIFGKGVDIPSSNLRMYAIMSNAYAKSGDLDMAELFFETLIANYKQFPRIPRDIAGITPILNMHAKSKDMGRFWLVVKKALEVDMKLDIYCVTIMIDALCRSGEYDDAIKVWKAMVGDGQKRGDLTFLKKWMPNLDESVVAESTVVCVAIDACKFAYIHAKTDAMRKKYESEAYAIWDHAQKSDISLESNCLTSLAECLITFELASSAVDLILKGLAGFSFPRKFVRPDEKTIRVARGMLVERGLESDINRLDEGIKLHVL